MHIDWIQALFAIVIAAVGYIIANRISTFTEHAISKKLSKHHTMLISRLLFYGLFLIFFIIALQQIGFNMTVLLSAAGIFTVALGFASQTAVSNLISGIFLIFERPFKVGDTINVNGILGIVESIDLLSTKIKTPDNALMRMPNESLMKSDIKNMSFYKTERFDIVIHINYQNNFQHVKNILLGIMNKEETVLQSPPAEVIISNFGLLALELTLRFWTKKHMANNTSNKLTECIKQQFDEDGIYMPSPLDKVTSNIVHETK